MIQYIHQTQSSLTYQMPTLFSKEHVISGPYPDILVWRMSPIWPTKLWPKWPRLSRSFDPLSTLLCTFEIPQMYRECLIDWFTEYSIISLTQFLNTMQGAHSLGNHLHFPKFQSFILPNFLTRKYNILEYRNRYIMWLCC